MWHKIRKTSWFLQQTFLKKCLFFLFKDLILKCTMEKRFHLKMYYRECNYKIVKFILNLILKILLILISGDLWFMVCISCRIFLKSFWLWQELIFSFLLPIEMGFAFFFPPSVLLQSFALWHLLCLFSC